MFPDDYSQNYVETRSTFNYVHTVNWNKYYKGQVCILDGSVQMAAILNNSWFPDFTL